MSQDINSQVPRIDRIESTPSIGGAGEGGVAGKPFSEYMQQPTQSQPTSQVSPMDLARQQTSPQGVATADSVSSQMKNASSSLTDIQNQLNTPNLSLKPSQKYLLRNKLQEANTHIRSAAEKVGVDVGPPINGVSRNNPMSKFLNFVTDGEKQLSQAQTHLKTAADNGKLGPAELMLMQLKLTKAQQEIEYSSTLLSKAVDDIKTVFNVQI